MSSRVLQLEAGSGHVIAILDSGSLPPKSPPVSAPVEAPVSQAIIQPPLAVPIEAGSIVGPAVGGVVGGAATFGAAGLVVFVVIRKRRQRQEEEAKKNGNSQNGETQYAPPPAPETPYTSMDTQTESNKQQNRKGSRPVPKPRRTTINSGPEDDAVTAEMVRANLEQEFQPEWLIPYSDLTFQKKLGQGAFGVVFRGKWRTAPVAIKQSTILAVDQDALEDFKQEALLMLSLQPHPNCVQVLGICVHETNVYVILELCPQGSLESLLKSGNLSVERKLKIISGFAAGVAHLHENGIIHRDLAARNILIGDGDVAKVRYERVTVTPSMAHCKQMQSNT